jgi:hypothetical protein
LDETEEEPRKAPGRLPPGAPNCFTYSCSDIERAKRIGEFWASPATRSFGELLIDLEEDRVARAVVVGMLREAERW